MSGTPPDTLPDTRPPALTIAPGKPDSMTMDVMTAKYLALRRRVAEIKERHSAELAPYALVMGSLENWMLSDLNDAGVKSMRTDAGTVYTSTRTSAKVVAWSKTLDYIREHEAWELLEARVNKTAAEAVIQETGEPIPGVEVSRDTSLNVRSA